MGSTFDYAWGTINQAFAAGQVGMFTGGSDVYTWLVQNAASTRTTTASRPSRSTGDPNAGVLGGGTIAAVNVVTTEARARRGRQVDRLLLHAEAARRGGRGRRRRRR